MPSLSTFPYSLSQSPQQILDDIEAQFCIDDDALKEIVSQFLKEFETGLGEYKHPMAMIPSFITGVPDGTETGTFLALDLGGTNLRVCEVILHGDKTFDLHQRKYQVSDALKTGEAVALFDYLAESVDMFLTTGHSSPASLPDGEELPLGLTFSFPVEQTALDEGILLTWTKGFAAKNAQGHDVVKLLQDAFDRKHLHVKCVALVNDTVGALLSRSYSSGGCILGAIFGTGTNGAYVEDVANIKKLANSPAGAKGGKMIVNTEWGAFNNTRSKLPSTSFDNKLDRESINPRFQAFEKFVSGMYLGEVTRNILLSLIDAAPRPLLFDGRAGSGVLNKHYGLDSAVMSEIEEAWDGHQNNRMGGKETVSHDADLCVNGVFIEAYDPRQLWKLKPENVGEKLRARLERIRTVIIDRLGFKDAPEYVKLGDAAIVRWACRLVAQRAARLSGCAVAATIIQTGFAKLGGNELLKEGQSLNERGNIGVGVDGSLIQNYPNFHVHLKESLRTVVGPKVESRVEIGMAKDGSGVGAALCALQAIKQAS